MPDPLLETDLPYRLGDGVIVDRHGHEVSPEMCLVEATPGEGWGVSVSVRGVQSDVSGSSPNHVVALLADRLKANGLEGVSTKDLWVNLNIIWMGRINPRHHRVAMSDLTHAVTSVTPEVPEGSTQIRHKADQWSDLAWGTLELYLCREDYTWYTFKILTNEVASVFSPSLTPTLGDGRLYLRMSRQVLRLSSSPVYTRDDAREWLKAARSDVMNEEYEGSPLWSR